MSVPVVAASDASASQSTSPISHTIPAGWSAGDLVVAQINTTTRTVSSAPSGWTQIQFVNDPTGAGNFYAYWKILSAGDLGASMSWTLNANPSGARIVFHRITGAHGTTPVDASSQATDGSSTTTHVSPGVTTTGADRLILRMMANGSQATTASSGDTGSKAYETTTSPGHSLWTSSLASAGATGTATYTTVASRKFPYVTAAIAPPSSSFIDNTTNILNCIGGGLL